MKMTHIHNKNTSPQLYCDNEWQTLFQDQADREKYDRPKSLMIW